MRTTLAGLAFAVLALAACEATPIAPDIEVQLSVGPAGHLIVASEADHGPGSFRAAVDAANADAGITSIRFVKGLGTIVLASTVTYTGAQPLAIDGRGADIDASGASDGFASTGGASLRFSDLTLRDAPGDGIAVPVPASAAGEVAVELYGVVLSGHGGYGLHLDDQTSGSAASLRLDVVDSRVLDTGFEPSIDDKDGIRVDEGGPGDIRSLIQGSVFTGNAADGIEYDEKDAGDVYVTVRQSSFDLNGTQPQKLDDLEDGFDIDEAGPGSIFADIVDVSASGNDDGGIDLDEEGPGDIVIRMNRVVAADNTEENIKASEDADVEDTDDPTDGSGGIDFRMQNVTSTGSGDNGIQLEEFGNGDVNGDIVHGVSSFNGDDGFKIDQADAGTGTVRIQASTFEGNADKDVDLDGVTVIEVP